MNRQHTYDATAHHNDAHAEKKLPVGIQDFEKLRNEGFLYVDKTQYLIRLIDSGSAYFLSRPRRFGKSLTASTFEALFTGKKELFNGLYAEEFFKRPDYRSSPVVHLDMSATTTDLNATDLRNSILLQLLKIALQHDVSLSPLALQSPNTALYELIGNLFAAHGPVVVLVDEYDKPILDHLTHPEQARAYRDILRGFYTQIKASDAQIRFVFMTGITKFTKTSVFSAMNNLKDLSSHEAYAQMLGYTDDELNLYFDVYLKKAAAKWGVTRQEIFDQVRDYYDGFSFDGTTRVFNPFSTLNFFDEMRFKNYWFDSGQSSFIAHYIKTHSLNVERFRGKEVYENFTAAHEIENAEPASFLFQAGYLTLREQHVNKEDFSISYTLDYPNTEVLRSVMQLFVEDVAGVGEDLLAVNRLLISAFDSGDIDSVVGVLNQVLASIPYNLFDDKEKYYHSLIYAIMVSAGLEARAEDRSKAGSADIVVQRKGHFYVIEVKTAKNATSCKEAAERAIHQILDRGYCKKFPKESTTLVGLAVDLQKREIAFWNVEDA